jgi:hypothetical protein
VSTFTAADEYNGNAEQKTANAAIAAILFFLIIIPPIFYDTNAVL